MWSIDYGNEEIRNSVEKNPSMLSKIKSCRQLLRQKRYIILCEIC